MPSALVTGANGFLAVPTIRILLERGYSVLGTVRSESKTTFLRQKFAPYGDKLQFAIVADLGAPGAFDQILKDNQFDFVLHTSSPFVFDITDVKTELYDPAIQGTTDILKSINAHAPSVKRVVITSSFASVINMKAGDWPGHTYTESDWNEITHEEGLADPVVGYYASKVLAEKAAWDFIEKEKPTFTLTTLCPPWLWGPPEQEITSIEKLNTSSLTLYQLMFGLPGPVLGSAHLWIDVRDAALAHVLALESPAAANQRYIIAEDRFSPQYIADFMWKNHPEEAAAINLSKGTPGKFWPDAGTYLVDNSKSCKDLGLRYRSFDEMLADTYARFKELEE